MVPQTQQAPEPRRTSPNLPGSVRGALRLALVVGLALAASCDGCGGCSCGSDRPEWTPPADPEPTASERFASSAVLSAEADRVKARSRRAHTLRIHVDRAPGHLHPLAGPTRWTRRIVQDTVFETLIRYQPPDGGAGSGPGSYQPGLARTWTVTPSATEVRLQLQPDVYFHDGKKLSSVDVQFTLDAILAQQVKASHLRRLLGDVTKVELVTARSVRIVLRRPNGYLLRALAEIPILPKHVYERRLRSTKGPAVGTGPYRVQARTGGVVHLQRWDDYWGPKPAIPDIEFVHEPDAANALTAAKRGELDIVPAMIPAHYPEQLSAPGISTRFEPLELKPPELRYLAIDAREPPLSDARVRRAMALLIDRKQLIGSVHGGLHRAIAGPVWPGGPGDGPAPAAPGYEPAEAYRLLDAAGWRDIDGDGRRERHGVQMRISLLATEDDDPERDSIIGTLRKAGIVIEQRTGPVGVLRKRLEDGDFDLALVHWRGLVDDDLSVLVGTGGDLNYGGFSDRRVDGILATLRETWDPVSRAGEMGELAAALADSWPLVPITAPDPHGLVHRRVRGVVVWNGWISLRALSFDPSAE